MDEINDYVSKSWIVFLHEIFA